MTEKDNGEKVLMFALFGAAACTLLSAMLGTALLQERKGMEADNCGVCRMVPRELPLVFLWLSVVFAWWALITGASMFTLRQEEQKEEVRALMKETQKEVKEIKWLMKILRAVPEEEKKAKLSY